MRRGLSPLGMLGTIIVMLVAAGVFLAILFQGVNPDTVASLQSCDEGVVASVAGPLLGDNSKLKCFSSRSEPKFPKDEEDCPDGFEENGDFCVSDGSGDWQYLLKMGCTDEAPYCWAQTDEAISTAQANNNEQQVICNERSDRLCKGKKPGDEVQIGATGSCDTCYEAPGRNNEGVCLLRGERYSCEQDSEKCKSGSLSATPCDGKTVGCRITIGEEHTGYLNTCEPLDDGQCVLSPVSGDQAEITETRPQCEQ